jgi:hypothetical protein
MYLQASTSHQSFLPTTAHRKLRITMTPLALAASNTVAAAPAPSKRTQLTPAETVKRYAAEHWTARGYCIMYTTNKSVLFHPPSNKSLSTDIILDDYHGWQHSNMIDVKTDQPGAFLSSLIARVRSEMTKVHGTGFRPIADRFYVDSNDSPLANTFKPFNPPAPADTEPPAMLLELFQRIAPVPVEQKLLIEWTAAIFQRPLERPLSGVILTGDSKCGKSSLVSVIKAGLGGHHVNDTLSYTDLWKEFSTVWADYQLLALEDQVAPRDADTRMKQPMSVKSKMFSIKNEQELVSRDMFSRTIITSNLRRPIRLDPTVRRWLAVQWIDHQVSEADSVAFFDRLYAWLATPEAAAQIVHFFRNVKIEVYNPNLCPRTPTLDEMIGQSTSVLHGVIKEFVADGHAFLDLELREYIQQEMGEAPKRDLADLIETYLRNEGYSRDRRDIAGVTKRPFVWTKKKGKRGDPLKPEDEARIAGLLDAPAF